MTENKQINRRAFLKVSLGSLLAIAGTKWVETVVDDRSIFLKVEDGGKESKHAWAMVIDQGKCTGCKECVYACQAHNDINPDIQWTRIYDADPVSGQDVFMPVPCMHCEHAPCVSVCPVKATYQRDDGIVMMDYDRCIGCRYCEVACPYLARSFNWDAFDGENPHVPGYGQPEVDRRPRGVVEKCSFCYQRIDRGLELGLTPGLDREATPACVVHCPAGARLFGDLNDPDSPVSKLLKIRHHHQLRSELGTGPRVYYLSADPALGVTS